jgi:hypothetical protein
MTDASKKMSVQRAEAGLWLVSIDVEWQDGQFLSFAVKHRTGSLSVEDLERSAIAQLREMLGQLVGVNDRVP